MVISFSVVSPLCGRSGHSVITGNYKALITSKRLKVSSYCPRNMKIHTMVALSSCHILPSLKRLQAAEINNPLLLTAVKTHVLYEL